MAKVNQLQVMQACVLEQPAALPTHPVRKNEFDAIVPLVTVPPLKTTPTVAGARAGNTMYAYLSTGVNTWVRTPVIQNWDAATVPAAGKLLFFRGVSATEWGETIFTPAINSVFGFDGSGAPVNFALSAFQPASNNLTTFAGIAPTPNVVTFLGAADFAAMRTGLGATTVGGNLFMLANPTAIRFLRTAADNTVVVEDAGTHRASIGATTVGGNLFTLANPAAIRFLRTAVDNTVVAEDAATHRASIGATTVGGNLFTLANPTAIRFLRTAADNTVVAEDAATHRASIGGTTLGQSLFTLANGAVISFIRVNADNTVTKRTAAEMRSDLGLSGAPVALTYAGTLTPDFTGGSYRKVTMSGNVNLNPPTSGTDGDKWKCRFTASGADRSLIFSGSIIIPTDSTFAGTQVIPSGKTYIVQLEHNGSAWMLQVLVGGY